MSAKYRAGMQRLLIEIPGRLVGTSEELSRHAAVYLPFMIIPDSAILASEESRLISRQRIAPGHPFT